MKNLNDEIKLTLSLMQTDIDDGAHGELQSHLCRLLEIKRNEIQQRLLERSWLEPVTHGQAPYKSVKLDGQIADEAKPLTVEDLKAGGWRLNSCKKDDWLSFGLYGVAVFSDKDSWLDDDDYCFLNKNSGEVERDYRVFATPHLKQIHRIGNQFFWSGDK